ncbi:hypothetical protein [Streptomyces sp. NPDC050355]|uniref:hypothetical protein n=1 Tax=Streptomyces sp. NPDC050355 TaxID=3365609 RepID=UPI0037BBFE6F
MSKATARFLILLLQLLLPARGCHRSADALPATGHEDAPTLTLSRVPLRQPGLLRGEDSDLVRPYFLTPDERSRPWAPRGRRRALWPAVHGYDAGPPRIHGVEVTG